MQFFTSQNHYWL